MKFIKYFLVRSAAFCYISLGMGYRCFFLQLSSLCRTSSVAGSVVYVSHYPSVILSDIFTDSRCYHIGVFIPRTLAGKAPLKCGLKI